MALINCPECGKQVSSLAQSCPVCGCPISNAGPAKPAVDVERYLSLALDAIKSNNSDLVEKYCETVLQQDPENSKAWEYEARGLLFNSSLRTNKVPQAINAAINAVNYYNGNKTELAESLYDNIYSHITGLLLNAVSMPVLAGNAGITYVTLCFGYYHDLIVGIPYLTIQKINAELFRFARMDEESRKAIMPKKRYIYASHVGRPTWAEQFRAELQAQGKLG